MDDPAPPLDQLLESVRDLAQRERLRSLWFLRDSGAVSDVASALEVLRQIENHGDLEAYRRAGRLRSWLSRYSSARS